jgi:hypothetical protein
MMLATRNVGKSMKLRMSNPMNNARQDDMA